MPIDLKDLARRGASLRVAEIQQELAALNRAFPGVARPERSSGTATTGRGRKPMTAAQRKAVGERMRKYWAARRKGELKRPA